ncbi:MAG: type II and III secretion system protein family protein [Alphaproteobacteria bacterium]|nr:type II and III secretion system protein family protein [Alphaproteobacteria bacterium]MBU2093428.1 type II and III secretion system protein family protein [Alphaproteobacteria bacterium]MBU2149757.1 type II and III secretion system protein family protein [Alphaproteobacteria bacterium]MBU2366114.1 type II and III secretion system protein family protein [Alphaproteobacteria bacterium]
MTPMSTLSRTVLSALAGVILAMAGLAVAAPAAAQTLASEPVMRRTIHVPRDKSLQFRLPSPASRIVIAQPEIAKVTATSESSFYVQGIEFGSTNMLVYSRSGALSEVIDIRVGYDAEGLQQDLVAAFPNEPIRVRNLGEVLMLAGEVSNSGVQLSAEKIAEKYAPESVISRLTIQNSEQVILEVRILEANRSALQDLGVNLSIFNSSFSVLTGQGLIGINPPHGVVTSRGGSGSTTIDSQLQALEEKGALRTLAKPNLVAISGQKASFLAGGEFPFPVPQDLDKISIQFKPYGVRLNFTPDVQDNGWIRLVVEPEVSQLDYNNALTVRDFVVPALTVRRASTTLELKPGDTFAMAGLFQNNYENAIQQFPGLGNLPVLGALFRSARWKRSETELIIIVTPRLSTPADRQIQALDAMPGKEPSLKDLYLKGKSHDKPISSGSGPVAAVK